MKQAQRRRDAALRRLQRANRGGAAASVAGVVIVMGLAHQATPVGTSHHKTVGVEEASTGLHVSSGSKAAVNGRKTSTQSTTQKRSIKPAPAPKVAAHNAATPAPSTASTPASAGTASSGSATAPAPVTVAPAPVVVAPAPVTSGAS